MTIWYKGVQSTYGAPSPGDFVPTAHGHIGVAEFNLGGGARLPVFVVRYDAPQPGFNPLTNGAIDAWQHAITEYVMNLDASDFDVIVLTLREGKHPGSGPGAYDVVEIGVGVKPHGSNTVLASVRHPGPQPAVQHLVDQVSVLTLH